jgi:hypothetical protein
MEAPRWLYILERRDKTFHIPVRGADVVHICVHLNADDKTWSLTGILGVVGVVGVVVVVVVGVVVIGGKLRRFGVRDCSWWNPFVGVCYAVKGSS